MAPSLYQDQQSLYNEFPYERAGSMASGGTYGQSDTASMISYNPSQISTVPSSASRLWNQQGYYESRSDVRVDQRSEARSHSTGRHSSSMHGSYTRSHRSNPPPSDYHSDVRSESTGKSHGSNNSKGRKNSTTVTYYLLPEPIPYRITIPSTEVTLGLFKSETKRRNCRFFFKSDEDGEVAFEEIKNDDVLLPTFQGKIVGKVEKLD